MFKGLMVKAAKSMWENTAPSPTEEAAPAGPGARQQDAPPAAPSPPPEITVADLGIELPYEPGEGTSCGAACRCRWRVDVRWSPEHQSNASFVTWVTASDKDVCPDCAQRGHEWQDVFIRPEVNQG
jgi:hypothetical protein